MENKKRKINIKVKAENIEVLKSLLDSSDVVDITILVNDTKDTYKKLSTDESIEDWCFIDDENNVNTIAPRKMSKIKEINLEEKENTLNYYNEKLWGINYSDWNNLSILIEAIRRASKIDSTLEYCSSDWANLVTDQYDIVCNEPSTFDIMSMRVIIESFYKFTVNLNDINDVLYDLDQRIKKVYSNLPAHYSVLSLSKQLFKDYVRK